MAEAVSASVPESVSESMRSAVTLPEYEAHPFTRVLPPILSAQEWADQMAQPITFHPNEREYPAKLRKHCVLRLRHFFLPMARQISLAETLDLMLRDGYMGRDPVQRGYALRLAGGVATVMAASNAPTFVAPFESTAISLAILGVSGAGKTRALERALGYYPQVILHPDLGMSQLTHLRIQCPRAGGPKQLCLSFFSAIDRLLGLNYMDLYGKGSTDSMIVWMAVVASTHALGILVIDEIQHLAEAQSDLGQEVLAFLVKLGNEIGIPVAFVGTPRAMKVLKRNFAPARRAASNGSIAWNPLPMGAEWDAFVSGLWEFQWTRKFTALTPQLSATLHDLTQGITSLVVAIFIVAQLRLISIGEADPARKEAITVTLLKKVFRDDFYLVKDLIAALRNKNETLLAKYDDLQSLEEHLDNVYSSASAGTTSYQMLPSVRTASAADNTPQSRAIAAMQQFGLSEDLAALVLASLGKDLPTNPLELMKVVSDAIARVEVPSAPPVPRATTKEPAAQKASSEPMAKDDLRGIVQTGSKDEKDAYEALREAGLIRPAGQDLELPGP